MDILVELSKDDVFHLKEMYGQTPEAFYVSTLMDVALRSWGTKALTVTSPGNAWKEDGSIVVFFNRSITTIFPFSLDRSHRKNREALLKTKRIDACSELKFHNILDNYADVISTIIRDMNRVVTIKHVTLFYVMDIEEARALDTQIPAGTYVKKLDRSHGFQINNIWPHKCENSLEIIEDLIERNVGFGLFLQENDCLVSWILQGHLGHMNVLQTEEEYKKRGYGKLMLKVMAKHLGLRGIVPVSTVLIDNVVSNALFQRVGFKVLGKSFWFVTNVNCDGNKRNNSEIV